MKEEARVGVRVEEHSREQTGCVPVRVVDGPPVRALERLARCDDRVDGGERLLALLSGGVVLLEVELGGSLPQRDAAVHFARDLLERFPSRVGE